MDAERELTGRVVAVTGAGRGLGLIITQALLERGATVVANHRSPSDDLQGLLDAYGDGLELVPGDIGDEATAEAIAARAKKLGRLDALVHNAGITRDQLLVRMSTDEWDDVMRVNLRGAFLATKHALRLMIRQRYGRLVYLSSVSAVMGNYGQGNYAASKSGLHGLSRTVAQEYATYNVRSVVLAAGLLDTGLADRMQPAARQQKVDRALLGVGDSKSVAATVAFLVSPAADFINAAVIRSDGGIRY